MSTEDVSGTDASRSAGLLQDIEHRYPAIYRRRQQRHARQEALNISKTVSDHELHVHFKDEPSVDLVSNTQTPRDTARHYSNNLEKSNGFLDTSEQEDISNCSKDNNSSTFSEKSRKVNGWLKIKDELWPRSSESADREGFGQQHTKSVVSNQSLQDRLQKNAEMLNHLLYRKSPFLSHQRLDQSSPVLDIESGSDASSLPYDKTRHKPSYQRSSSLFSVPFSRPEYEQEHSFPSDANVSDQMPPMVQDVSHSYENRSDGHDYTDNLTEHKSFTEICQNLCKQRKNKAYEDSGNLCFSCSQSVKISGSSTLLDSPCDSAIDVESSSIKSSHSVEKLSVQIPQNGLQVSDISNLPKMPDNQVKISTWKVEPADFQWIHQNDCVGDRQCSVTNDSDIHHLGVSAVTGLECVNPRFLCHVDADSTDLRYLQDGLSKLGQPSCGSSTNRDDLSIRSLSSGYTDSEIFNHTPRSIYTPRSNVTTAGGTPRRIAMKWRVQSATTKHTATEDSGHSSEKELEEIFFNPRSRQHAGDAFSTPRSYHLSDDTDDIDDTDPRFVNPAQDNKTSELKLRKKRHYIVKRPQSTPLFGSMQSFDNRISKTDEIFNNKGGVSGLSSNSDSDVCRNLKARSKSASDCENLRNRQSSESSHRTEEANQNSFSSCSNETDSNCRNSHVNDAAKCWHPNNDRDIEFFMRAEFLDASMKPKKNRLKKFLKKKRGKYNPMLQEPQLNCNAMQRPLSMPNLLFDNAFVCSESKKLNKSFDELSSPSRLLRTCDTNALHGISLQKDASINKNGFRHLETSSSSRRHSEPEVQDIKSRLKPNNSGNSLESGLKNNKQEIISNVQTIHNGFSQPLSVLDRHNIEGTNSNISWSNASDCGSEPNQSSNYTSIGNTSQNISELDSASFSSQAITNKGYPDRQFSEEFRNKTDVLIDYDTTQPGIYNAQTQQRIGKQNYISNENRINCHNSCVSQKKIQSFSYPCISSRHPGLFMNDEENHPAQKRTQSLSCPSTPSHRQISDCAGQISSLLFDLQNELHLGQTVNVLTTEGEYCSGDERGRDSLESEDEFERIKHTNIQVRRFSYSESERNVKMVSDSKFSDAAIENVNSLSNTHVPSSRKDDVNSDKVNESRDSTEQLQKPVKKVRTIFTTSKSSTESIDSTEEAEDSDSTPRKSDFPFVSVSPHNNPCNKTDFCDDISPYATSGGMESKGINSSELTKDITNKPYWKNDIQLHQISSSKDPYATIGELSDKDMDEDVGGLNKVDDKPGIPAAVSRKEDSYLMNSCNGEELNSCYDKEDMYATINKNKVITVDHTGDGNKNQKLFAGRHSVSEIQNMEHKSSFEGLEGACGGDGDDEVFSKEEYCPPVPDRKYKRLQSSSRLKASKELSGSRSSLLDKVGSKIKSMKKAISMDNGLDDIDKEEKKKNKEKKVEKSLMSLKSLTAFFSKKRQHKLSATTDVSADPALQNLPAKDGKSKKCHKYQKKKSKAVPSIGSVESPTQFRLIGKLTAINPDGSQMVELKKPPHGPIGFYIARGTANYDYGLLVSRFSADNPEKLFAGILGVGDEILEINETPVTHLTLEEVYELMAASDKLILKVFPLFARKDV